MDGSYCDKDFIPCFQVLGRYVRDEGSHRDSDVLKLIKKVFIKIYDINVR